MTGREGREDGRSRAGGCGEDLTPLTWVPQYPSLSPQGEADWMALPCSSVPSFIKKGVMVEEGLCVLLSSRKHVVSRCVHTHTFAPAHGGCQLSEGLSAHPSQLRPAQAELRSLVLRAKGASPWKAWLAPMGLR